MFFIELATKFFAYIVKKLYTVWFYIFHFYIYKPFVSSVIIASLVIPIFLPWGNLEVFSKYTDKEYDLVMLLVDEEISTNEDLHSKITRYAYDVQNSYTNTKVSIMPVAKDKTSEEVYRILENFYFEGQEVDDDTFFLKGLIIVGDVVLPRLKSEVGDLPSIFPYTDFEKPSFIWDTEDKKWIENPQVNATSAEIWHGVIPGSLEELKKFFDKNHDMHEKLYSGNIEFSDIVRDEILFWNSKAEKKSIQKISLLEYEKGQDLNSDRKSFRYNTELLKSLYTDIFESDAFANDIPAEVKNMYPKDEAGNQNIFLENIDEVVSKIKDAGMNNTPDRYTKASIEKLLPFYAEVVKTYEREIHEFIKNTGRWDHATTDSIPGMITLVDEYVANEIQKMNKFYENKGSEYFKNLDSFTEIPSFYGENVDKLFYTSLHVAEMIEKEGDYHLLKYLKSDEDFSKHLGILRNLFRWVHMAELHDQNESIRKLTILLEAELEGVYTFKDFEKADIAKITELWNALVKESKKIYGHYESFKSGNGKGLNNMIGFNFINGRRVLDIEDPQDCSLYRGVYQSDNLYRDTKDYFNWKKEKKEKNYTDDISNLYNPDFVPEVFSKSVKFTTFNDVNVLKDAHKIGVKTINKWLANCSVKTSPEDKDNCVSRKARLPVFSWDGGEQVSKKEGIDEREFRTGLFSSELYKNVQNIETSALACQNISMLIYGGIGGFPDYYPAGTKLKKIPTFILHNNPSTSDDSERSLLQVVKSIYSKALASNRVVYADVLNGLTVKKYIKQTFPNFFRYQYKKSLESSLVTQYELSRIAQENAKEMIIGNGAYNRNKQLKDTPGLFRNSPIFKALRVVSFDENKNTVKTSDAFIMKDDDGKIPAEYELEIMQKVDSIIRNKNVCNNISKFDSKVLIPKMKEYYASFFQKYTKIPIEIYTKFIDIIVPSIVTQTWEHKIASELISCDVNSEQKIKEVENYIKEGKKKLNLHNYFIPDLLTERSVEIDSTLNNIIDFSKLTTNNISNVYWKWDPLTTEITPEFAKLDALPSGFTIPDSVGKIYFESFEVVPNFNDVFYKYVKVSGASFLDLRKNSDEKSDLIIEVAGRTNNKNESKKIFPVPDNTASNSVMTEEMFYEKYLRFKDELSYNKSVQFYTIKNLSENIDKPDVYPVEVFPSDSLGQKQKDFLFYWNTMTAHDKHDFIQKIVLSKNQEIIPPLQEKNLSKPYAYADWNIDGENSPEWLGEDDITSSLLGLPTSDYYNSQNTENTENTDDDNTDTDTDDDEQCGPIEGVPLNEWLDAIECWLDKMKDLPDLGSKKKCNLSLEEFKKLQEKNDVDTKNPVKTIEVSANIDPLLPEAENKIIIRFKTKENKLAYGHDIRFTVDLENAKMRDVINDFDENTDGYQLINRTGEEAIEIIPNKDSQKVVIHVTLLDSDIKGEYTFSVIPNDVDIFQIIKVPDETTEENFVKAYGLKIVSPIEFKNFDGDILLSVSPHEEGVLSKGVVKLNELFHVAVRTDNKVRVNASMRGVNSASIDLNGLSTVKNDVAEIQLPNLPATLDVNSVYYFTPRYLNAMGSVIEKPETAVLRIDKGNSAEDFEKFEINLIDNNTRVKIETHGIAGGVEFALAIHDKDESQKTVNTFIPFIGEKTSVETYESLNINALYATITGLNKYEVELQNHFATKMLHSSDNLNVITTHIAAPKVKKPVARMFQGGKIETYASGYRANVLDLSPVRIGLFDKKELRYKGKFKFTLSTFTETDLYIGKPGQQEKGIFSEKLESSTSFSLKKEGSLLQFILDDIVVAQVDVHGNIRIFDNTFRIEIEESRAVNGLLFLLKKNNSGDRYARIIMRGGVFEQEEESIWVHKDKDGNYFITETDAPLVDLFPMYQTPFSKLKNGVGFQATEKYVLEYAAGNTVGEATQSSADLFMINIGDPSLSIPPPLENGTGFNETIGNKVFEEETGVIQKILPLDFDGDGVTDIAEVTSSGYVNILLNTGDSGGNLRQWGKAVRIDPKYRMISVLKIQENAEDVYDDLVYIDRFGVFHHLKNIDGNISIVDNPEYFPQEILSTSQIDDLNKDGFSDIVGITEAGDFKIWYGKSDYFTENPVLIDSYTFTIPTEEELKKSVLITFKNIETLSNLLGEVKRISYKSSVSPETDNALQAVNADNQNFIKYNNEFISAVTDLNNNTGLSPGVSSVVSEKQFLEVEKFGKSLTVLKKLVPESENSENATRIMGKKYITQLTLSSSDQKAITFTIADLYGELMEIDRNSVECFVVDENEQRKKCTDEYAGVAFPSVSRGVIFENITLKPGQKIELSYVSTVVVLPHFSLKVANINKDKDDILDLIVKSKNNNWLQIYVSDENSYKKQDKENSEDSSLENFVSNGIDLSILTEMLDDIDVSDDSLSSILNYVKSINGYNVAIDNAVEWIVKDTYRRAQNNTKKELFQYLSNLLVSLVGDEYKDDIKKVYIDGIITQLLEWDKVDEDGNPLELTKDDVKQSLKGVVMAIKSENILEESGVTSVVNSLGSDDDDDNVPNIWDHDFDEDLENLEDVIDDTIDFLASCNAGGCLNMPMNYAFFATGDVNLAPLKNQAFIDENNEIGSLLSAAGVDISGSALQQDAIDGVGDDTFGQPFVMTIFNYGKGTVCIFYKCIAYSPPVPIPFEAGFANSKFRIYLSPTITGGLGFVVCTGSGNSTSNPGGSCFIQAIEGNFGEICNKLSAKINQAVEFSGGSENTVFRVDGSAGGQASDTGTYSLANIDTSIPSSQNVRLNSEGYFGRWFNRQLEELGAMFTVPFLTILYPDVSNTFFDTDANMESFSLTAGMVDKEAYNDASTAFSNDISNVTFENQWADQKDEEAKQEKDREEGYSDASKSGINSVYDYVTPQGKNKQAVAYTSKSIDDFYRILDSVPLINMKREVIRLKYPALSRKELLSKIDNVENVITNFTEELENFKNSGKNWPKDRWNEHQKIVKKAERFLKDITNLNNSLYFYKDEAGNLIQDFDSQIGRYIYSIVCYMDAITDLTGGWFVKNKIRYEKWLEFFDTIKELIKMYEKIPDILNGYQASCSQCRATEYDSSDNMVSVLGSFFPEPPVVHFPRIPDIVLDVSQINAAITVTIPKIVFSPVNIKVPKIPHILLPNVPTLSGNINFPKIPNLPTFELPTLPAFPEIDIPKLPNIPPPPKLPDIPSSLLSIMTVVEKALYLYCIVVRQGIFLHDETTAMSTVEVLTNRPVNPLSMDFISKDFPDIVISEISEIEVIAEVNLEKNTNEISKSVHEFTDEINKGTTTFIKEGNRNLSENVDKYGDPMDLTDNKYVKKVEREVDEAQSDIDREVTDKNRDNINHLDNDVEDGLDNIQDHIDTQEDRNQENIDNEVQNIQSSQAHFDAIVSKDMQKLKSTFEKLNNPKNYISVNDLRKKMGLPKFQSNVSNTHFVLNKYTSLRAELLDIQKYYTVQEKMNKEAIDFFAFVENTSTLNFPEEPVYAIETNDVNTTSASENFGDMKQIVEENMPTRKSDEGIFIQSNDGGTTVRMTAYTDETSLINSFLTIDINGDGKEDIVYATPYEIYIKYAEDVQKYKNLKHEKKDVYVPKNGDVYAIEEINFDEVLPEFLSPKNLTVFGDGKKLTISILPEPKELIWGIVYTVDDAITYEQRKNGKVRKYIFQLLKESFDTVSEKYTGLTEADIDWDKEVGENFIIINGEEFFIEPNSTVRIDKFDYEGLETFVPFNEVKSLQARWITADGKLSNYASHDLLFNTQSNDIQSPILLGDIKEEKLMYKESKIFIDSVLDLENGDSYVSWDTDNDGVFETLGNGFLTKIHEIIFEKETVPFKVVDGFGNETQGTAYVNFVPPAVLVDSAVDGDVLGHVKPRYGNVPVVLLRERFGVLKKIAGPQRTDALGNYTFTGLDTRSENLAILKNESGTIVGSVDNTGQLVPTENSENYEQKLLIGDAQLPLRQVLVNTVTGKVIATLILKSKNVYSVKFLESIQSFSSLVGTQRLFELENSVFVADANTSDTFVFGEMPLDAPDNPGGGVIFDSVLQEPMVMIYSDGNIRLFDKYKNSVSVRQKNITFTNEDGEEEVKVIIEILRSGNIIFEVLFDLRNTNVNIDFDTVASTAVLAYDDTLSDKYEFVNTSHFLSSVDNLIPNSENTSKEEVKILPFTDISKDRDEAVYTAVKNLYEKNMISGYETNEFKPNQKITRAEFVHEALAVTKCLDCINPSTAEKKKYYKPFSFSDITPKSWYDFCISKAKDISMIKGYKNGEFRPNQNITRAEAVAILLRQADIPLDQTLTQSSGNTVGDVDPSQWFYKEMITGVNLGLITPTLGFAFPNKEITRGEFAIMADKIFVLRDCREVDSDNDGVFDYLEEYYGSDIYDENSIPDNIDTIKNPRDELLSPIPDTENNTNDNSTNENNINKNNINEENRLEKKLDEIVLSFGDGETMTLREFINSPASKVLYNLLDTYDYKEIQKFIENKTLEEVITTTVEVTENTTTVEVTENTTTVEVTENTTTEEVTDNTTTEEITDNTTTEEVAGIISAVMESVDPQLLNQIIYIPLSVDRETQGKCESVPEDYDGIDDEDGCPELEKEKVIFDHTLSTLFVNNTNECSFVDYADEFREGDKIKVVILSPDEKYLYKESGMVEVKQLAE